mgnify:CR=1 FL=1
MLWAILSPVAAVGLTCGFLVGLGLRIVAQRLSGRLLGVRADRHLALPDPRTDIDPIGALSVLLVGTGWGRGAGGTPVPVGRGRVALAVLTGPVAAIVAAQVALAAFVAACPGDRTALLLNRPSDLLHGAVARTAVAQLILSVAVALLCFGLLALLPLPPLDGYRLARMLFTDTGAPVGRGADVAGSAVLLVLAAIPVGGVSPLLMVLDTVGTPLLRIWT